jgi:hypothetical protein
VVRSDAEVRFPLLKDEADSLAASDREISREDMGTAAEGEGEREKPVEERASMLMVSSDRRGAGGEHVRSCRLDDVERVRSCAAIGDGVALWIFSCREEGEQEREKRGASASEISWRGLNFLTATLIVRG